MALKRCPECRAKISETAPICIQCGFNFDCTTQSQYQQTLENHYQHNQNINRQNAKLHLIWLSIFTLVLLLASWWLN